MSYHRYDFSNPGENQINKLHPHPLNKKIYGSSAPDADLLKSVAEHGVFNPIIVNRDKEILSGNRRWLAAKAAGYTKVPVLTLRSEKDDFELVSELFLIESNRARIKTLETQGREYKELKRIETALAKQRQKMLNNKTASGQLAVSEAGEAAAKAASAAGLGVNTAKKLEAVVDAADAGSKTAKKALEQLNTGDLSVSKAYRETAKPKKPKSPEKISAGVAEARGLMKLFDNAEVTRSKKDGYFHLTLKDLTPSQITRISKTL